MKVLGIDTTTTITTVGVVESSRILGEIKYDIGVTHSEILLSAIDDVLKYVNLKVNQLDAFAISIGPGSFTGLRIGLSTVKGLSIACGKPVVSVLTLDALAYLFPFCLRPLMVISDAKKDQVYAALYDTGEGQIRRRSEYMVLEVEKLVKKIPQEVIFVGSGVEVYQKRITDLMGNRAWFISGKNALPSGGVIAKLGEKKVLANEVEDLNNLQPFYIRSSDAELKYRNV